MHHEEEVADLGYVPKTVKSMEAKESQTEDYSKGEYTRSDKHYYHHYEGVGKMEGINSDKVNINLGEGGGGGAGAMAALVAALGNRNQGDNSAALIAALGNRNESDPATLAAIMNNRRDDSGMNSMWPLLLLLLAGKRGGLGGGDDCAPIAAGLSPAHAALLQTISENLSDVRASVPTTALETQNALQTAIAQLALGTQQAFANTKDAVQATGLINLQATNKAEATTLASACETQRVVLNDGIVTRARIEKLEDRVNEIHEANLQRKLGVAEALLGEERSRSRIRDVEVSVNQTVTQNQAQAQAQAQQQQQFSQLFATLGHLASQVQLTKQNQDTINFGTMLASANQQSNPVQVK